MRWNDPVTSGITPFNILSKTITNDGNSTIEIVVHEDGRVEYTQGEQPIFLKGVVPNNISSVNFTHHGGFKDNSKEMYCAFELTQQSETFTIYIFTN